MQGKILRVLDTELGGCEAKHAKQQQKVGVTTKFKIKHIKSRIYQIHSEQSVY